LKSNSSALHDLYGYYLECMGRFEEAIAERHRALELDPFSPAMNEFLSLAYIRARRYEEAVQHLKNALDLFPNYHRVHGVLSVAHALAGARQDALHHGDRALALSPAPHDPSILGLVGWVYGVMGMRSKASELLDQLNRLATQTYVDPFWLTLVLVGLNDKDRAIESITRAVTQRSPGVVGLMVDPWWDPLRQDPRFQELVRRMDFPEPPTLRQSVP
jgi:tetratricopeptide (TPR) repeat protein